MSIKRLDRNCPSRKAEKQMVKATGRPAGRPRSVKRAASSAPKYSQYEDNTENMITPEAPDDLRETGIETWNWVWSTCEWLKTSDALIVWKLCRLTDERAWLDAQLNVEAGGKTTYRMPNGVLAHHPLYKQRKDVEVEITAHLSMLGLTPTDRMRLEATEDLSTELRELFSTRNAPRKRGG